MPKFKGRKTSRGQWDEDLMRRATDAALSKKMSIREAALKFGVPRSTLHENVKKVREGDSVVFKPKLGRFENTFSDIFEDDLKKHMIALDTMLMPLTRKEFLSLAFELAESLGLDHRFSKEKRTAGKNFYYSFMKRHPELSLRTPESTSLMRMVGFNRPQVARFFEGLKTLMDKFSFRPSRIYNGDETGVSCVHKNQMVISTKGKRQVGKLTSGERGRNVTLMFAMSALGNFIPPMFIFPRVNMNQRLMIGSPDESIAVAQSNGWMNGPHFLTWLKHFSSNVSPTKEDPVLLIIDGHGSHKELEVLQYASANNIHMLSTPPHTTHKLQPLDRSFMKPFKDAYNEACSKWMRKNAGLRISDGDIAGLVSEAYSRVCRMDIAKNGFACAGIYPYDPQIFTDLDFMPSQLTERSDPASTGETQQPSTSNPVEDPRSASSGEKRQPSTSSMEEDPRSAFSGEKGQPSTSSMEEDPRSASAREKRQPSTSSMEEDPRSASSGAIQQPSTSQQASHDFNEIISKISPIPDASHRRSETRKRRTQRSEILTNSPYKNMLKEKRAIKETAMNLKAKKKLLCTKKDKNKNEKGKHHPDRSSTVPTLPYEDVECIICGESFTEDLIECHTCKDWAHEQCTSYEGVGFYTCDVCLAKGMNLYKM